MDSAGFEPVAVAFRTEGSALRTRGDLRSPNTADKNQAIDGPGGIRTRGLYVANVTIYP